jgi:NAD(P)-dependent dehydrogenase (short-subunit alcohol dehydrogenase family)
MQQLLDLKGKTAVVTGGAKGIGKATADLMEQAGARVVRIDTADAPGCVKGDVADEAAMEKAFAQIGGVDILVNNAGIGVRKQSFEITSAEWQRVLDVNLSGLFFCSRIAARSMKERGGGAIINLASIMGFSGGFYPNPSYHATKGAVVNLTRTMAMEFAPHHIRVNAVAPTWVRTDLTVPLFSKPELFKKVMENTPLGVLPDTGDIAAAILFLAGPAARCITGVTLPVDSGYLAQ